MQQIVAWTGRDDAKKKTPAADPTGFSVSRRKEWISAKYGKLDVKDFDKMHIIQALHGKICAVVITDGSTNDSPVLGGPAAVPATGLWRRRAVGRRGLCQQAELRGSGRD